MMADIADLRLFLHYADDADDADDAYLPPAAADELPADTRMLLRLMIRR